MNNFEIRFAVPEDVPIILQFIKELAEYEKLSSEVSATETLLYQNLFGDKRYAEVILGYVDDEPVAFALFFHNFSTFLAKPGLYLEDLYVKPAQRGKKIGRQMLVFLAQLALERQCGRLEWWVLDWNKPAIQFYKQIGAKPMDDWTVFRLDHAALLKLVKGE